MTRTVKDAVWAAWEGIAKRAARSYVPGPALDDALRVCHWLSDQRIASTIGFWDGPDDTPPDVVKEYLAGVDAIGREKLDCYLSIKVPSIRFDRERLAALVDRSLEHDVRVHFDSHGPEKADETFAAVEAASARHPALGCTLPSRWVRSLDDVERAVARGWSVRVVKGQWADPAAPAMDARANYLAIVDRLAGRVPRVAVATHDVPLLRKCLARLLAARAHVEVELLYGLPVRPAIRAARELGVPVRLYVPYGEAYLPYTLTQARKQPRVFWWVIRDTLLARTLRVPRSYARSRGEARPDGAG
jgi:proline dehydrogenase